MLPLTLRLHGTSPPSRAAWIEINKETLINREDEVAAFTGGVD